LVCVPYCEDRSGTQVGGVVSLSSGSCPQWNACRGTSCLKLVTDNWVDNFSVEIKLV
jgi:hypothetical protein